MIHYSCNLGQTGSCNFSRPLCSIVQRARQASPHSWGGGRAGGGWEEGPLESGPRAAADGDVLSVHTAPGIRFPLIIACKPRATGFLCYFLLQGQRGGQKLWEEAGTTLAFFLLFFCFLFFGQGLALFEEFFQLCKSLMGKLGQHRTFKNI